MIRSMSGMSGMPGISGMSVIPNILASTRGGYNVVKVIQTGTTWKLQISFEPRAEDSSQTCYNMELSQLSSKPKYIGLKVYRDRVCCHKGCYITSFSPSSTSYDVDMGEFIPGHYDISYVHGNDSKERATCWAEALPDLFHTGSLQLRTHKIGSSNQNHDLIFICNLICHTTIYNTSNQDIKLYLNSEEYTAASQQRLDIPEAGEPLFLGDLNNLKWCDMSATASECLIPDPEKYGFILSAKKGKITTSTPIDWVHSNKYNRMCHLTYRETHDKDFHFVDESGQNFTYTNSMVRTLIPYMVNGKISMRMTYKVAVSGRQIRLVLVPCGQKTDYEICLDESDEDQDTLNPHDASQGIVCGTVETHTTVVPSCNESSMSGVNAMVKKVQDNCVSQSDKSAVNQVDWCDNSDTTSDGYWSGG